MKRSRIGRAHNEMIRIAVVTALHPDLRLGELGQPNREIDVGVGIVGAPAEAALLAADAAIHQAAEMPRAVEVGDVREFRRRAHFAAPAAAAAEPALRLGQRCGQEDRDGGRRRRSGVTLLLLILSALRERTVVLPRRAP